MRWVRKRVCPDPGPALTKLGPYGAVTALRGCGLSLSRKSMEVFNVQMQGKALRLNESLLDFRSTVRAAGGLDRDGAEAVRTLLGDRFCSRRRSLGGIGSLDDHKDH